MGKWLFRFLPFVKSFFGNRLLMIAIATAFAAGSSLTWYITGKIADANLKDMYKAQLEEKNKAILRTVAQYEQLIADNDEVVSEYILNTTDISNDGKTIAMEIEKYENNPDCNVPAAVVGMLNHARTGDAEVPTPSGGSPPESLPTKEVTAKDEYHAHAECGLAYRELKSRNDLLIEWINKQYPN